MSDRIEVRESEGQAVHLCMARCAHRIFPVLLHPFPNRRGVDTCLIVLQDSHIRRRRRCWRSQNVLEYPLPPLYGRGPRGIRRNGQDTRLGEDAITASRQDRLLEFPALNTWHAVKLGEWPVDEAVISLDELQHAQVIGNYVLEKQPRFRGHVPLHLFAVSRVQLGIASELAQLPGL